MGAPNSNDSSRKPRHKPRVKGSWSRGPELQERDVEILRWIARHGVVTPSLVARRFFWRPEREAYSEWAVRRRLGALSRLGLIVRDYNPFSARELQAKREEVIRVSREGARIADVGLQPAPLVISELRHTLGLVRLCESLLVNNPTAELVTEREIRAQRYRELHSGEREVSTGRAPDALLRIPTGTSSGRRVAIIAVELDLSRKDARAMERMIRDYDREDVDRVWWFVTPERLQRTREFVKEMHHESRVQVFKWPA